MSGTPSSLDPLRTLLGYPVAATSLGDVVGIILQDQSLHQLQQVLDGANPRPGCRPE